MSETKTKKTAAKPATPKKTTSKAKKAEVKEEAPARSSSLLPLLMIIVIIQIGLAGFYAWKLEQSKITGGAIANEDMNNISAALRAADERIKAMEEEIQVLNDTIDELGRDFDDADTGDDMADLEDRISDIEIKLEELDKGNLSDDKVAELIAAKSSIEALQKTVSSEQKGQLKAVSQLTALDQIAQGVQMGQPYAGSLSALNDSLSDTPELLVLSHVFDAYQDGGAPSIKSLQTDFSQAVDAYYAASNKSDSPVLSDLMNNLSKLITIRKVGDSHAGGDDASRIARAEANLADGKLKEAVDDLRALSNDAAPYFYEWLKSASDYASLRESLTELGSRIRSNIQKAE